MSRIKSMLFLVVLNRREKKKTANLKWSAAISLSSLVLLRGIFSLSNRNCLRRGLFLFSFNVRSTRVCLAFKIDSKWSDDYYLSCVHVSVCLFVWKILCLLSRLATHQSAYTVEVSVACDCVQCRFFFLFISCLKCSLFFSHEKCVSECDKIQVSALIALFGVSTLFHLIFLFHSNWANW